MVRRKFPSLARIRSAPSRSLPNRKSRIRGTAVCSCTLFFFQAEDGIRYLIVTGVQTCALPIVVGYILAYVFALKFDLLPVQGYTPLSEGIWPWLQNLILPSVALGCVYIALIARITRAAMLEVLQQDYIRTARAKGLGQGGILFVHALKNAAVPIVTVIGIGVALLIGGAVVTESVFAIPGLGRLTIDAILRRDYPVIQGIVLLFSFLYVLVNLMVDVTYTLVDPRIRY